MVELERVTISIRKGGKSARIKRERQTRIESRRESELGHVQLAYDGSRHVRRLDVHVYSTDGSIRAFDRDDAMDLCPSAASPRSRL